MFAPRETGLRRNQEETASIELEIAIDGMALSSQLDHLVINSGSGDFKRLVDALQRRGAYVTIVSTLYAPTLIVANALRRQANTFVELWDLRIELSVSRAKAHINCVGRD